MATFVSASSNTSQSTSSLSVALPSGLAQGDLLVAGFVINDTAETITPPSGWIAIDNAPSETGTQEGGVWYAFYAAGMNVPTWSITAPQKAAGTIVAYRGVDQVTPCVVGIRGTRSVSSSDTIAPSINTVASSQEVLGIFLAKTTNVTSATAPGGMIERSAAMTTGGGASTAHIFSQTITSPGTTGDRVVSYDLSGASGYGILIALNDAQSPTNVSNFTGWGIPLILTVAQAARFLGDPGVGNYYFGGREDQLTWANSETAISNWESRMAPWSNGANIGIVRVFSNANVTTGFDHVALCNTHYANGRIPHISFKLGSIPQSDAVNQTGQFSGWMDALSDAFKSFAPNPIWWTFWHEPENDSNWQGATNEAEYRQVCRNIKLALDARGVTNSVFWAVGYMCPYTFGDAGGTRDWRAWYPDWKGTTAAGSSKNNPNPTDFYLKGDPNAVTQGIGLDVYSWWNEGDPITSWDQFGVLFDWANDRMGFLGHAYNIMEHGVVPYHTGSYDQGTAVYDPTMTLDYLSGMYDTMIAKNIVALQVYNYALVNQQFRLEVADPNQYRYHGYGLGLTRPNYKLPTII